MINKIGIEKFKLNQNFKKSVLLMLIGDKKLTWYTLSFIS